ncbi:MAG TPA: OB-fold nucleic acid binding domain-containing protein [Acidimicrobiia bacterium]|jgi:RecG-like helicase
MTFLQRWRERGADQCWPHDEETSAATNPVLRMTARAVPIAETQLRTPVVVTGKVTSVRVQPRAGVPTLDATIVDETGRLVVTFLGRRHIGGIEPGRKIVVEGVIGDARGRAQMLNPIYRLL